MSHSSGIAVSTGLVDEFGSARNSTSKRLLKVQIIDEARLEVTASENASGSWENDFGAIQPLLKENEACYILYRLDTTNALGFEWVLFSYVPDKAKVREKMLYSSTKANLKLQLGSGCFIEEVFGTVPKDLSLDSYQKWVAHQRAEAPLTRAEIDRKEEEEQGVVTGGGGTGAIPGVQFPVEDKVIQELRALKDGSITMVQLVIDPAKEKIMSGGSKNVDLSELAGEIPIDEPRFTFFNWRHEFNGEEINSIIYIYSSPDGSEGTKSAPVKLRMLYSSSKANVVNIANSVELTIATRLEVNKGSDVTEESLRTTLHPQEPEKKQTFSRPKAAGRGPARLTKGK